MGAFPSRLLATVLALVLALAIPARGQDTTAAMRDTSRSMGLRVTPAGQQVLLVLRDGSRLLGRVNAVGPTEVRFASAVGETRVPRSAISAVQLVAASAVHDGELWPENPSRSRLFFAPTGRMLRAGELYLSDVLILFPSLQAGITDRVSFGGGLSIVPGIGLDQQLFYITPKVGLYASDALNIAAGALLVTAKDLTDESPIGMAYAVSTFGPEDASVTTGVGLGFSRSSHSNALLMLGGERREARSFSLVSENYLYAGSGTNWALSGGVRFLGEHIAVDLAAVVASGAQTAVPYLSFDYKW